ncbi:nicotinate-nucleotide--dimethylbenzimidazole phosphoribosyltransferase [Oharaeibacter diazotrophicus]|uniref:Nicotinate-nucleotide--dimethylbenzimidazole phosphoribosyltransferase n=2 Tax=Oharaeibacter diazotrophicus TaxID=1920512 RepID=A0A4R6RJW4_9HYPH|nr:nicotinate-nucleotide--dimethylbenzimidazole phosphoribosyltransferase [Oharaeibacter diazotrophicus]TDP86197.1 nicotinate-nucleotide-dimethylbenzimidazole phosphoribosyltransferase [Oharaeibacter diazotrophicus]BBE71862.1 nicotinate-nucleotide-dimethylbenzimidazole phosphoribosyltransferase [Pleomorphomonas sp. SM30]GLS78626.1 nicotinate-nucleotide--dimethylbenzimidazole phosphoribosyltransferase [Oharaeibacter diazotrophicus]
MSLALSALPFDDIRSLVSRMPGPDADAVDAVRRRDARLTKPAGSLGRLETLVEWLAAWQARPTPRVDRPVVSIFAANHGVAARGVSAFPPSVTEQMVANFAAGGAAINQMCVAFDLGLKVLELALEVPTPDITVADAFDEAGCAATIAFGMESVAGGADLLIVGEMGIGNTTVAAAIYHGLYGGDAADWVGRGTGVDDEGLARKRDAVAAAVARLGEGRRDPLEVLRRVGGREIAAMVGALIAARFEHVPVIVDGFVATAAAAVLHAMDPAAVDHVLVGHRSAEGAHGAVLERLGKTALLDLGLRLGEGTGAALAAALVKAAAATHAGMATFDQAGVAEKG